MHNAFLDAFSAEIGGLSVPQFNGKSLEISIFNILTLYNILLILSSKRKN